ncbi:hypothetical protein [Microvirga calopogonii]|uniref:hypothetical protein n=1 Tax=Microvirga calopogonii TaxID=2078013 RepID=UPI0013B37522|nr:hypothetical protein [Microvirga calopogonii]
MKIAYASSRRSLSFLLELTFCSKKLDAFCFSAQNIYSSMGFPSDITVFQRRDGFRCFKFAFFACLFPLLVSEYACIKNQVRLFACGVAAAEQDY